MGRSQVSCAWSICIMLFYFYVPPMRRAAVHSRVTQTIDTQTALISSASNPLQEETANQESLKKQGEKLEASNIPVLKKVEAIVDPEVFTIVRFTLSAIPFIPFVLRERSNVHIRTAGIELGFWVSLGYLMQALGLLTSDAGRASFISLFTVIVVPLLDGMLGAKVPALTWLGAFMSVLGVAMLETSGSPPCYFLAYPYSEVRIEHISRNSKKENFLALFGYEVCVVAVFSIMWYLIEGWFSSTLWWDPGFFTSTLAWNWIVEFPWVPVLYMGIFLTGLCLWVEMAAMRDVSATETAIIYGLESLWSAGFAWFLLGERWGIIGWIGAALVLGGSLTVQIFGSLSPTDYTEEQSSRPGAHQFLVNEMAFLHHQL